MLQIDGREGGLEEYIALRYVILHKKCFIFLKGITTFVCE